jgi:hypothetical protein
MSCKSADDLIGDMMVIEQVYDPLQGFTDSGIIHGQFHLSDDRHYLK